MRSIQAVAPFTRITASLLIGGLLLLLATAPVASADGEHCATWDVYVGDDSTGAGASVEEGATIVAAGGFYIVNDGPPFVNPWLLSIWIYEEQNGQPGLQRSDEVCDQSDGGRYETDGGCWC